MNTKQFRNALAEALRSATNDPCDGYPELVPFQDAEEISNLAKGGLGLLIRMTDGSEFEIRIRRRT